MPVADTKSAATVQHCVRREYGFAVDSHRTSKSIGWHGWMKAAGAFDGLPRELRNTMLTDIGLCNAKKIGTTRELRRSLLRNSQRLTWGAKADCPLSCITLPRYSVGAIADVFGKLISMFLPCLIVTPVTAAVSNFGNYVWPVV